MHNFTQVEVEATNLAADQAVGIAARDHHSSNGRIVIAHYFSCRIDRHTMPANRFMIERSEVVVLFVMQWVKHFYFVVEINAQSESVDLALHAASVTDKNRLSDVFINHRLHGH